MVSQVKIPLFGQTGRTALGGTDGFPCKKIYCTDVLYCTLLYICCTVIIPWLYCTQLYLGCTVLNCTLAVLYLRLPRLYCTVPYCTQLYLVCTVLCCTLAEWNSCATGTSELSRSFCEGSSVLVKTALWTILTKPSSPGKS